MRLTPFAALATMIAAACAVPCAAQGLAGFETGPVFEDIGPHTPVESASDFTTLARFEVAFDVADAAEGDARNRKFESAARFINMHVANGVSEDRIKVAVVVHGGAVLDLITDAARDARDMDANGSAAMVREMLDHGVRFIVCGQSAAVSGVSADDLIEGVEMELSAMTAHALLQQDGYTVNPF